MNISLFSLGKMAKGWLICPKWAKGNFVQSPFNEENEQRDERDGEIVFAMSHAERWERFLGDCR